MDLNKTPQRREAGGPENPRATSRPLFEDAADRAAQHAAQNQGAAQNKGPRNDGGPREPGTDPAFGNIAVDIYDQVYHLRGPDPEYLQQLSALVDAKMRAVAQQGATVDSLRVAVLAALNLADELVTLRQQQDSVAGNMARSIQTRTETLAEMLDAALESTRKAG